MLSPYGKSEWLTITVVGVLLAAACLLMGWWIVTILIVVATLAVLSFFRDPERRVPSQRNVFVAPADGKVSSIHVVEQFEPLGGPATCVRIFLSVLDVHVNRSPCHGQVSRIVYKPGEHLNALNPDSAEVNESNLIVLLHPIRRYPVAAIRQVAGLLARTIACAVREGDILQRGQRIGMIKLGSTTEVYIPHELSPRVVVEVGQKVKGGLTVVAHVTLREKEPGQPEEAGPATDAQPQPVSEPLHSD
jgi:phosphatidylserine decarboxylase